MILRRTFAALPRGALVVGLLASLMSLAPFLYAQYTTPPGWHFTGNLKLANPDYMQYRVWFRQTQREGPLVRDIFTTEPNRPHVLVLVPYAMGTIARWLSITPEQVSAYAGAVLAVVFSVLLFVIVRRFFPSAHQRWWVFLAALIGGGLGGHLKLLLRFDAVKSHPLVKMLLWDPLSGDYLLFEDYRGHFAFTALFDTHFLLNWTLCAACLLAFYYFLVRPHWWRLAVAAVLCGLMTLVHLYEGVTLLMIVWAIALLCWIRGVAVRLALTATAATTAAIVLCLAWQASLRDPNVPIPSWRGQIIAPAILFVAYPLAWVLAMRGLPRLWREADAGTLLLLGWLLGCTALTLSGPFYPYPDRGTLTLQIPLTILAGLAYFRDRPRVTMPAALVAVALLGVTPLWVLGNQASQAQTRADAPAVFQNASHRTIIDTLTRMAGPDDVMLARQRALVWLAPEYPGRYYCAHFFMTVDFERKRREVERFFAEGPDAKAAFMRAQNVRFVFVEAGEDPDGFSVVPGVRLVLSTPAGALFEHTPAAAGALFEHAAAAGHG